MFGSHCILVYTALLAQGEPKSSKTPQTILINSALAIVAGAGGRGHLLSAAPRYRQRYGPAATRSQQFADLRPPTDGHRSGRHAFAVRARSTAVTSCRRQAEHYRGPNSWRIGRNRIMASPNSARRISLGVTSKSLEGVALGRARSRRNACANLMMLLDVVPAVGARGLNTLRYNAAYRAIGESPGTECSLFRFGGRRSVRFGEPILFRRFVDYYRLGDDDWTE